MGQQTSKIIWTEIDEAPALATYSFLPIVQAFTKGTGVEVETRDISLSGRIISNFPDYLKPEQRIQDFLAELGALTLKPEANIIKLPNISASIPQLVEAVKELQAKGYALPNYPETPTNDAEKEIQARFAKVLGSAVNPVLREGNSDRRAAAAVKSFGQKKPHRMMKPFEPTSKSHVAHMTSGDFYGNEKSVTLPSSDTVKIEFVSNGQTTILKDGLKADAGEILSTTFMSKKALRQFYADQIADAKANNILLSLHLKATMMKVSDPVMFGHAVSVFYAEALDKHAATISELGFSPSNGLGDLYNKLQKLSPEKRQEIENDIQAIYAKQPALAMVDSDNGITNLHVPNDVIVDASMPVVVRDGGKMWGADNKLHDTKAMVPDRSYATMYKEIIEDCRRNGAFDPSTMGSVSNVGLMAQKAEEYGSHPTTFIMKGAGEVRLINAAGQILTTHQVEEGDIWRMSRVKDIPVQDWVKLAVTRARVSNTPAIFWLDKNRAHDAQVIIKVEKYLKNHDVNGLDIRIADPVVAMKFSVERIRKGLDTISVTGNVLRDYLTDLFPILELGTSAKMLSIVPLLNGGGLFETGAGGSAPKHVQQFLKEGHLRWDSLGEFCALTASFEHISQNFNNAKAQVLAETLDTAVASVLENGKSPSRKANELDNRGSHFYLALYWAEALANQNKDSELKARFAKVYTEMKENEGKIVDEIAKAEGKPADIGGYYRPVAELAYKAMRPSATLNAIIDKM